VLEDNPELQQDVVDSTLARIPVIGAQLDDAVQPLTGSGPALAIGLVGALWGGLGVTLALTRAFCEIGDVPRMDQPRGLKARVRGLAVLALIAIALIASTVLAGLAIGGGIGAAAERVAAVVGTLAVNFLAFLAVFGLLTVRPRRIRDVLPGVALTAIGSVVLQSVGGWFVDAAITNASDTYGAFALVIGLLSWFLLGAHLLLVATEANAVLRWRLWPRSLTGALEPADQLAFERAATATLADPRVRIAVSLDDDIDEI
jgi:membrane protein